MANQHNVRVSKFVGQHNQKYLNNRNALFKKLLRLVSFLGHTRETLIIIGNDFRRFWSVSVQASRLVLLNQIQFFLQPRTF